MDLARGRERSEPLGVIASSEQHQVDGADGVESTRELDRVHAGADGLRGDGGDVEEGSHVATLG